MFDDNAEFDDPEIYEDDIDPYDEDGQDTDDDDDDECLDWSEEDDIRETQREFHIRVW